MTKKAWAKLFGSILVSAVMLTVIFSVISHSGQGLSPGVIVGCIVNAVVPLVAVYALCHVLQTFLRAVRARMLLRAGMPEGERDKVPGLWHVSLVTFVRGACVDLLPMRIGELSYVAMLSGGYKIPVADALSSLSIGLLLDFFALLIVLVVALVTLTQGLSFAGTSIVLFMVCLVGGIGLFFILPWFARQVQERSPAWLLRRRWYAWCAKTLGDMADAVVFVRRSGKLAQVLALSAVIRFLKYLGLYFLFIAITARTWPDLADAGVPSILVALISAEGAASLPVPTIMSFGSYEAGGLAALTALGFTMADSMAAMLSTHLLSQLLDYSLGGIAFLVFMWSPHATGADVPREDKRRRALRSTAMVAGGIAVVAVITGIFLSRFAPEAGASPVPQGIGESVEGHRTVGESLGRTGLKGMIAWSSNRDGNHGIYAMDVPSGRIRRLTTSEFTDTYPRISPDGKRIAFSRSHRPYVSQRDQLKWDTWVLDLASGKEALVATNAFTAVWDGDGESLLFVSEATRLERQRAEPGAPREVVLEVGKGAIPGGNQFQTPNVGMDGKALAFTLRGATSGTYTLGPDGALKRIGGGCEITWRGRDSATVLWVDHPGKQQNTFFETDSGNPKVEALIDVEGNYSHEYFPRYSRDGRWLVYGASTGGHEHDQADYEIFLWESGKPQDGIVRITWHTGNDCWPDIYIAQ